MPSEFDRIVEPLVPEREWFKHAQLDQERSSIRLIHVLRDQSTEGLIQCKVTHAFLPPAYVHRDDREYSSLSDFDSFEVVTTAPDEEWDGESPSYSCLSYMWGDPHEQYDILLDGKIFKVRSNLRDFLLVAQDKFTHMYLWIDALCIDQQNTLERNHQVQQMGNIYSRANMVFLWLGNDLQLELVLYGVRSAMKGGEMESFSSSLDKQGSGTTSQQISQGSELARREIRDVNSAHSSAFPRDIFVDSTGKVEKLLEAISEHEYWSRAWVTQEILLARRTTVLAGRVAHNLHSLAMRYRYSVPHYRDVPFENIVDILLQRSRNLSGETGLKTWGVINLLHRFRKMKCSIQRDRIYSLLALCHEGEKLKVDYNIPEQQLMHQVMGLREQAMCFCSAAVVSDALGPWNSDAHQKNDQLPFVDTYLFACSLGSAICPLCSNWVPFSWTRKKGLLFCLGIACPDTQGHIFWESPENPPPEDSKTDGPAHVSNPIYVQIRENNKSHLLCHEGAGIDIKQSPWSQVYSLRFTFRRLVELLKEDFITHGLGLNACANMWPDVKDGKIGEGRLKFCI